MLMPKRTKYRKMHKGRMPGKAYRGSTVTFGDFALQAVEPAWISSRQIEAARRSITNYLKRGGKVWIRIFPDKPVTHKPAEVRMGSGKGSVEYWVAVVKPGRIMFELAGVSEERAKEALRRAAMKMPMACQTIVRDTPGLHAAEALARLEADQNAEAQATQVTQIQEVTA